MGYRASIEAQAYRQAAKEGLKPADSAFWNRREALADSPTTEAMNEAIEEGYRLTYISELGETGKKLSAFINSTKLGQLVMPFTHIPLNILKRSLEGTPAAFLDADTRAALTGKQGAVKQDMAVARMVAGSAVGAWAINLALNDRLTGFGPDRPEGTRAVDRDRPSALFGAHRQRVDIVQPLRFARHHARALLESRRGHSAHKTGQRGADQGHRHDGAFDRPADGG
jgi:hypothetical protein